MEMEEKKVQNKVIFLTVVGVATLLISLIAATFSFFSATVSTTGDTNSVNIQTATVSITYDNGPAVGVTSLMPEDAIAQTKVVKITNTSTVNARYGLSWTGVSNPFTRKQDLTFTMSCTVTGGGSAPTTITSSQMPSANGQIFTNQTIDAGAMHTCTFSFAYAKPASVNQNADQDKEFKGNITIVSLSTK